MVENLYANTPAASGPVALGEYVFVEGSGQLQIQWRAGEYATRLIIGTLLALGGVVWFSLGLLGALDAERAGNQMLLAGALALLGLWLLSRTIAKGRTLLTFDRNSGKVLYRGKPLRSLSSITHLTIYATGAGLSGDIQCYVEFSPSQSPLVKKLGLTLAALRRKEILHFMKPQEALQAATVLATFLGVRVFGGEAGGLKVILTGNGRDIEHLDFQSGKPGRR